MKVFYCENQASDFNGIIIVAANSISEAIETAKNDLSSDCYFEDDEDYEECFPEHCWKESNVLSSNVDNPQLLFIEMFCPADAYESTFDSDYEYFFTKNRLWSGN